MGRADEREPRLGFLAETIVTTACAILHDGDDQVGIKRTKTHGDGGSDEAFAFFGGEDGSAATIERFADEDGKDPARVGTFEFGGGGILTGDMATPRGELAGGHELGSVAWARPKLRECNTGVDQTQRGSGLCGLERRTCHHGQRTGKSGAMMRVNVGYAEGLGGFFEDQGPDKWAGQLTGVETADNRGMSDVAEEVNQGKPVLPSIAASREALRALPAMRCALSAAEVVKAAEKRAKQGKLAGFARGTGDVLFVADVFGEPFDRTLVVKGESVEGGTRLTFTAPMKQRLPWIFIAVIAFSIWPGVTLTHSLLVTYFSWYTIQTWWWYIPITVLPLPWMYKKMMTKSEASCAQSVMEQIESVREAVDGKVE